VSFILDALRKSEHERQRSAVPGLSQVPLAAPQPQLPRWALGVIGVLVAAVLVTGGAWWQTSRAPAEVASSTPSRSDTPAATVERKVELPAPTPRNTAAPQAAPSRLPASDQPSLSAAAASSAGASGDGSVERVAPALSQPPRLTNLPDDSVALPSVTMLAAEGVAVPPLRLELHAFGAQPRDRFVFINGRKYVEGDRLVEGPMLVAIEPAGAVLTHAGRRFILVQE
jgi:general secretion pathway protein B